MTNIKEKLEKNSHFNALMNSFRLRKRVLALSDALIVVIAGLVANYPLPLFAERVGRPDQFLIFVTCIICCFGSLLFFGAYNKLWRYFSKRDYLSCVKGIVVGIAVAYGLVYLFQEKLFWEFAILHAIFATIGISAFRYLFRRTFVSLVATGHHEAERKRTMIIGAGNAAQLLLNEIRNNQADASHGESTGSAKNINPVCLIDDDRYKIGKPVGGVLVAGTTSDIPKVVKELRIELIIFAIPSCPSDKKAEILEACAETNCEVKVVPEISKLISGKSILNQTTKVNVEDLLGREPVKLDTTALSSFIAGKTCMVTGGGGSIGSELCRQIMLYKPRKLVIVDIYENNAYDIQQELIMNGMANAGNLKVLIDSVRDREKMESIFKTYKPDLVFHAAAHKHVPLMETSPEEAVKNNIFGTYNVADLSDIYGVKRFVLVSTDKAVNPTNVMGATKRFCEMIVQNFSRTKKNTEYVAVRFGNVLGSNGSVIPLFKKQIESGKPVTITHPDIIRYFMTIPEAVSLILTAGSMAHGGEIFVLDMGKPVKILTLAENLIKVYGKKPYEDVEIIFTGLRPGEKLYEELLMSEEGLQETANHKVFIGTQIEIDDATLNEGLKALKAVSDANNSEGVAEVLAEYVPTFHHKLN